MLPLPAEGVRAARGAAGRPGREPQDRRLLSIPVFPCAERRGAARPRRLREPWRRRPALHDPLSSRSRGVGGHPVAAPQYIVAHRAALPPHAALDVPSAVIGAALPVRVQARRPTAAAAILAGAPAERMRPGRVSHRINWSSRCTTLRSCLTSSMASFSRSRASSSKTLAASSRTRCDRWSGRSSITCKTFFSPSVILVSSQVCFRTVRQLVPWRGTSRRASSRAATTSTRLCTAPCSTRCVR